MRGETIRFHGVTSFADVTELDLGALGPGVFAVTGANGAGKTTFMELMGPGVFFRTFPSRVPSSLGRYIGPKGGAVAYTFTHGGERFKADLRLDAAGKTVAATMLRWDGAAWAAVTTGKARDYDALVARMLPPLPTYLASLFAAQSGVGRFETMGVSARKEMFRWYLGLEGLDEKAAAARTRHAALTADLLGRLAATSVPDAASTLAEARTRLREFGGRVVFSEKALVALEEAQARAIAAAEERTTYTAISGLTARIVDMDFAIEEASARAEGLRAIAASKADAERRLEEYRAERSVLGARAEVAAEVLARHAVDKGLARDLARLERRVGILADVPCQGLAECADCQYLTDAVVARDVEIPDVIERRAMLPSADEVEKAEAAVAETRSALAAMDTSWGGVRRPATALPLAAEKAAEAATQLPGLLAQVEGMIRSRSNLIDQRARTAVEAGIGLTPSGEVLAPPPAVEGVSPAELKAARVEHQTNVTGLAQARLAVAAAKTALKEAEENAEAIARLELEVEVAGLLVEALGPNGFQAYEFAMAGPAVSALVNDLLQSCLGARFAVDVVTLRPKRSGGGFTEAFEFIVTDAEAGENRDIGQLSGGERAMVSEAIRVGLSLYASRRMAVKFETMMRDEPTSALSGENARAYVRMLRRAAEIGGFHQIFFVTHDRGASEIADGEIRVTNRGIEVLPCRGY